MKTDRKPTYSKDNLRRVVSVANGQFKGIRELDPWFNRGSAGDYDVAMSNIGQH